MLLNPDNEYSVTDLANRVGASLSSVHDEVQRLEQAGIVASRQVGRSRLIRAGSDPLVKPLTSLIQVSYGPVQIIAEEFADLPGIETLLLFGSWAARYHNVAGPAPNDIDVLVVESSQHSLDRDEIYRAAERAEQRLGRPVNPTVISARRWRTRRDDDALLQEIFTRPVVQVSPTTDDQLATTTQK